MTQSTYLLGRDTIMSSELQCIQTKRECSPAVSCVVVEDTADEFSLHATPILSLSLCLPKQNLIPGYRKNVT
jgi:hypothetical protein